MGVTKIPDFSKVVAQPDPLDEKDLAVLNRLNKEDIKEIPTVEDDAEDGELSLCWE
jgi:hypothetical protein